MAKKKNPKKPEPVKHEPDSHALLSEKIAGLVSPGLLIIFSFFYFFFVGERIFFYQENSSLFIYSGDYFHKFAGKAGGLLEYAGYFLTQFYFNPLFGTLIITGILLLIWYLFKKISRRLGSESILSPVLILLPSLLLLLVQMRYDHLMHLNLGFLATASWFLLSINAKKRIAKFSLIALFPLFIYLTGSFAIIYAGMYITYCIFYEQKALRIILPLFLILVCLFSFMVFRNYLLYQPAEVFLSYPLSVNKLTKVSVFLLLISALFVLFPVVLRLGRTLIAGIKTGGVISLISVLSAFLITGLTITRLHDPDLTLLMDLEKKLYEQDWDGIIRQQEKEHSRNVIGQYYYNLALSEKGILTDRLFFGPQDFGSGSLCLPRDNEHYNRVVYFYYYLGLINEARHLAYESMVGYGYRPESIKLLIKTELINGNFRMAEKYINILKRTLHYRAIAMRYEKMINNSALVRSDPELGEKQELIPKIDFFVRSDNRENVRLLWLSNTTNRKAFEYLMAWMLLDKDLKGAVGEIKNMNGMGYKRLPRFLQEAVIGYANLTNSHPDPGGFRLDPDTELRFNNYGSLYVRFEKNRSLLEKEIREAGGNTLWYYMEFK